MTISQRLYGCWSWEALHADSLVRSALRSLETLEPRAHLGPTGYSLEQAERCRCKGLVQNGRGNALRDL